MNKSKILQKIEEAVDSGNKNEMIDVIGMLSRLNKNDLSKLDTSRFDDDLKGIYNGK